eukprot:1157619-Pelagomonas_calceolata.AAC.25
MPAKGNESIGFGGTIGLPVASIKFSAGCCESHETGRSLTDVSVVKSHCDGSRGAPGEHLDQGIGQMEVTVNMKALRIRQVKFDPFSTYIKHEGEDTENRHKSDSEDHVHAKLREEWVWNKTVGALEILRLNENLCRPAQHGVLLKIYIFKASVRVRDMFSKPFLLRDKEPLWTWVAQSESEGYQGPTRQLRMRLDPELAHKVEECDKNVADAASETSSSRRTSG